jgi:hypothetical protein
MVEHKIEISARMHSTSSVSATLSLHGPLPPNDPIYARVGHVASEWVGAFRT